MNESVAACRAYDREEKIQQSRCAAFAVCRIWVIVAGDSVQWVVVQKVA
jgi:hypothetical protein